MPNIQLPDDFPERLRAYRIEHGLAESELATRAGLTYKTIRDLEMGKRRRVMERTILVLAEALGLTVDELLGDESEADAIPAPPRPVRPVLLGSFITLAVVMLAAGALAWYARTNAHFIMERDVLTAVDPIFHMKLWDLESDARFHLCEESPWDDGQLLVGLGSKSLAGGRLLCLKRATGDTLWSVGPDVDAIRRAFGSEIVDAANFSVSRCASGDFDGDGEPDLVVNFTHGFYYPGVLVWIDRDGRRLGQYANKGHIYGMVVFDNDDDGRDEVVAWGTNNAKAYQGGTVIVLDSDHWRGASLDADCGSASAEPDSALLRLVVPQFTAPYMEVLGLQRLQFHDIQVYRGPDGGIMYGTSFGAGEANFVLALDDEFRPSMAQPADGFLSFMQRALPDSLVVGTGPSDKVWTAQWLAGHKLFEAGHWPPTESMANNTDEGIRP
ncbi:MAG: helix-turn-helix domain-containing protein [bacterium]|nr:helix-turn-helix domain-containing protein [bacterium]